MLIRPALTSVRRPNGYANGAEAVYGARSALLRSSASGAPKPRPLGGAGVTQPTRSQLLRQLDNLRMTQDALADRLRRVLTAMAMSAEASADIHARLDLLDDPPNGHVRAATAATAMAQTYRRFLASIGDTDLQRP